MAWAGLLAGVIGLAPLTASGQSKVTLAWDPSPDSTLMGYRVYQGAASETYTNMTDVGTNLTATITCLPAGLTNYIAVTAYDTNGLESAFSAEIQYVTPVPSPQVVLRIARTATNQVQLSGTAPAGNTYDALASQSLTNWIAIGSVTADAYGNFSYLDAVTAPNAVRCYRLRQTSPPTPAGVLSPHGATPVSATGSSTDSGSTALAQ
jgi:chitinase